MALFIYLPFMHAWNCVFQMWRLTRAAIATCLLSAECSTVMCEQCDLIVGSSQYDLLLWSEPLVSDRRHMSQLLVLRFGRHDYLC